MIAPDKIYVQPEWITGPERNYIYDTEPTPCAEEYIRKDAILEWANGMSKAVATLEEELSYRELIEHIKLL